MKIKQLGATKLKISEFGVSCQVVDEQQSVQQLHKALDEGVNFFDAAEHEMLFAKAFKNRWNDIVIAAQCNASVACEPGFIKACCEASLNSLNVSVIDLYYLHALHDNCSVETVMTAVLDLIAEGKIRYLGLSHVSIEMLRQIHAIYPVTAFRESYESFLWYAKEAISLCEKENISFMVSHLSDKLPNSKLIMNEVMAKSPSIIPIIEY